MLPRNRMDKELMLKMLVTLRDDFDPDNVIDWSMEAIEVIEYLIYDLEKEDGKT